MNERFDDLGREEGISLFWQCAVFFLVAVIIFLRRPDMFTHAQFYAEDGEYWYAQAYNIGWLRSLLIPQAGYLQTLPRLATGLALLFPLREAPLVTNCFGLVLQALPVTALLSARCRTWAPLPMRAVMATIYILAPNAPEIHVVVTNAQWHAVVLEILLALGASPRGWAGRIGDCALFFIGAVSGPFGLMLLPFVLYFWWRNRLSWTPAIAAMLFIGSCVQVFAMLHTTRENFGPLGATMPLLMKMLGKDIVLSGMLGMRQFLHRLPPMVFIAAFVFGAIVVGLGLRLATLPLRLFAVFTVFFFAAALHSPFIRGPLPLWQMLSDSEGCRYWFYPMLVFLWSAVFCVFQGKAKVIQATGTVVLLLLLIGIVKDFRYAPFYNFRFDTYVGKLQSAQPGKHVVIPLAPGGWTMDLVKHGPGKP